MPNKKRKNLNVEFFKHWSSSMAYVLGFFAADGNLAINPNGYHYIEFNSCDRESIETIRKALDSNHKIARRKRDPKWKTSFRIQISSGPVFKDLIKLGMKLRKSNDLKFPTIPNNYVGDFVRGYFDGDGHVHLGQYWRKDRNKWHWVFGSGFTSGSKDFLLGLWNVLKKHVSGGCLYKKIRGYELNFSRQDSLALFKLMYDNTSPDMFLKRKYDIFLKAFKTLNMGA